MAWCEGEAEFDEEHDAQEDEDGGSPPPSPLFPLRGGDQSRKIRENGL